MKNNLYLLCVLLCIVPVKAQKVEFADDALQRGYYNRPYQRYEAEPGCCLTNGTFLSASDNQRDVQSEASNQQALTLAMQDDQVSWILDKGGDGLTVRFSLPDATDGKGLKTTVAVYCNDRWQGDITLDSYWAWQYTQPGGNYPDNTPAEGKMVRMRFDEVHLLLKEKCVAGAQLKLVKKENDNIPCTIDFVELEDVPAPVLFDDIETENKVMYSPDKGYVTSFVAANAGKTIYFPAGTYDISARLYLRNDNTRLVGAGMWYTTLYFSASSDQRSTHSNRGIEANANNLLLEGFYINTINNKRYYDNNPSYQVGKGLMGSWGVGSVVRNCWIEHFECGGWIATYSGGESRNLLIEHCRFRNNYADGINLCQGSTEHTIRYCSFRNNGDDDMASWSTGQLCVGNTFAYCTSENNWRASGLGLFGGKNQTAHHLAVYDPLETGVRVNSDFAGTGFAADGNILLEDISIHHAGCTSGNIGVSGDFWGNMQGACNITATANYNVSNLTVRRMDIQNSRSNALYLKAGGGKKITGLRLQDIHIDGAVYGIYFSAVAGDAEWCNLTFDNLSRQEQNVASFSAFSWVEHCSDADAVDNIADGCCVRGERSMIYIEGASGHQVSVYDVQGRCRTSVFCDTDELLLPVSCGLFLVSVQGSGNYKVLVE
ncbi:MAG: DUF6383 domain-containing protein [Paludibacter sp.]|nr:DUF6383 domain-containing protein [Bacteroidales bacterium]MCM1069630.1 DUF6383 domain-containing protein [Prevotella sp.]MCM1354276.1 DUF6383 domain-containing protein [Bacteroides sp.]MCM1443115.1 DUF6383 domain-containing protein [Muribaculum sp.]MCM1482350.1 DUF6383 domain-containing protein [Paludibacter sp.]